MFFLFFSQYDQIGFNSEGKINAFMFYAFIFLNVTRLGSTRNERLTLLCFMFLFFSM